MRPVIFEWADLVALKRSGSGFCVASEAPGFFNAAAMEFLFVDEVAVPF